MQKYTITVRETLIYGIQIKAKDLKEAETIATNMEETGKISKHSVFGRRIVEERYWTVAQIKNEVMP